MIYTIGHKESYEQYFKEYGTPKKKGRTSDYAGGSVFKNMLDAVLYAGDESTVYGVLADWEKDTVKNPECPWHDLLIDAPLVNLHA